MDESGRNISPWKYMSLAMSRSIEDTVGTEIGVISTPLLSTHTLHEEDSFIVLASDGV